MKETQEEHHNGALDNFIITIVICLIFSGIYFLCNYANTYYSEELESICFEKGYEEITDYKKTHTETTWYGESYKYTFQIECDGKVLESQYELDLEINRDCIEKDKWGACRRWGEDKVFSKPHKSYWIY